MGEIISIIDWIISNFLATAYVQYISEEILSSGKAVLEKLELY